MAKLLGASAFSLPVAIALTPELEGLFWAGFWNLWVFLVLLIPLFLLFHQIVKHVPMLEWELTG